MIDEFGSIVRVGNSEYDISHLNSFIYTFPKAPPNYQDIRVRVSFSCHVFSKRAEHGAVFDFEDHNGNHRIFCPKRYKKCLILPSAIHKLLDQDGITWEMKDHNNIENMAALAHDPTARIIKGMHDVILYYLYPSNSKLFDIEMNVLTCYERPVNTKKTHKKNMKQVVRTCYFTKMRVPMTEEKRRELANSGAAEVQTKKAIKRKKRKEKKTKAS